VSFEEFEECFVWRCGACGLSVEFPPHNFSACWAELKSRGWRAKRDAYDGGWSHNCARCERKAVAEIMNRKRGSENAG
jgi:hypothetical protein